MTVRAATLPFVALTVFTTFACSLDKLTQPQGPDGVFSLAVTGDTLLSIGGSATMSITTPTGPLASSTAVVVWSSDQPTIAAVNPTSGVVTAAGIGQATISAKVVAPEIGEVTATARQVRVKYAGIRITAVDSLIAIGMTKVITVRGTNAAGTLLATIPFSTAMQVVSRDVNIFDVNTSGALVAKVNGTARLFVQHDGNKDSLNVKVRQVTRSITFTGAVANELPFGSINRDRTLAITARDSLGVAIAAPTVTWGTSDATTITIGAATGIARALKLGTATITATTDGFSAPILARVTQVPATLTKLAGDALSATVGAATSTPPRVAVLDSGNTPIPGVAVAFTVASGGGSVAGGTQTSAAGTGQAAATSWTLGTTAGANTLTAAAGNASASFTATGTPGVAVKLIFSTQPTNSATGSPIQTVRVAVADSNDNIVTTATNAITISVASGPGTLGGTVTVAAVSGIATFSTLTLSSTGVYTLSAAATGLTSATSNSFAMFGPATKLAFTTQPSGGTAGIPLTTFRVAVQDAAGNTATSATNTITLTVAPTAGVTFGGTISAAAVAGVATFSNVTISPAGTYTITAATTGGLTSATSTSFTVVAVGPAAKLAFTVQPSNAVAAVGISPDIKVAVQDANGVTNTSSTAAVTLAIETNVNGATLSGVTTVNAVAGIATFTGISLNKAGTGYKLNATSGSLTKGVSSTFNIVAGGAFKLGFAANIPNAVVASAISPAVQVQVQDQNGNVVTTAVNSITITSSGGAGTLTGGAATATTAGVASFSSLALSAAGAYTLVATATGLQTGTSTQFNVVTATAPIKLAFTTQPSNVASGVAIAPSIQVAVQDNSGATVSSTASVTLTIATGPVGGTITGQLTRTAVAGIATFDNLTVPLAGNGYSVTASSSGLTSATSATFNVTPGAPNRLAFLVQPATATAGVPFANDVQVAINDVNNNLVATATNTITIAYSNSNGAPSSTLKGTTTVTAVNGIATFPGLRVTRSGSAFTFFASSSGLSNAGSATFDITPAPATALSFRTQPAFVTAGATQASAIQVSVVDSVGNTITANTNPITLSISSGPTGATMSGTALQNAVAGVATFADITFPKVGNHSLAATATDLATATSVTFFVQAGAATKLAFSTQPTNTFVNAPMSPGANSVQVQVQDAFGNQVTSNAPITIAIGTNPVAAVLNGTLTTNASFGSMTVPQDVKISKAGTGFTLTASTSGLTGATSTAFDVGAFTTASRLIWVQQPATNVTDAPFRLPISVAIADQYNNIVTTAAATSLTIGCQQGCTQVNNTALTSSGVATFTNYTMSTAGTFNLFQNGGGFFGDLSVSFIIGASVATTSTASLYDVAINGANAFYIERPPGVSVGSVKQVSLTTGATIILASGLNNPAALVTDGTNVYWIEDGSGLVKRVPVGGGATVAMSTAQTNMGQLLQTDGTSLFFIANNAANTQREIKKIAMNAAAGTTPAPFYTASCGIAATCVPVFAISGTTLYYWRSLETNISSVTTAGGVTSTTLVTGVAQPTSMTVGGNIIFWSTGTALSSAPSSGGSATSRGTPFVGTTFLAYDGTSLYSLDQGNSTIKKFSTTDFSSISLTTTTAGANTRALAFDANFVFWADNLVPPRLRRVAK